MNNSSKHAYLYVIYNNYEVNEYSMRLVDDPRNTIFILIDVKSQPYDVNKIISQLKYSKVVVHPGFNAYWASHTQIQASFEMLELAYNYDPEFQYYHLFQGADLPIKTQDHIHQYFDAHYPENFVEFNTLYYSFAPYKRQYYHWFVNNAYFRHNKFVKILNHGLVKVQQLLHFKRRVDKKLYSGSACFSITDRFAKYALDHKDRLLKEYKYTLAGDELVLQTELMSTEFRDTIHAFEQLQYGNARLIEWKNERNSNSPTEFTIKDYDKIISADEHLLFARKFRSDIDPEIVKKVFDWLIVQEQQSKKEVIE